MSKMWLCPIVCMEPFVLGAGRIPCLPSSEFESFRDELRLYHPRLLMMFKANALLGEPTESDLFADEAGRCGIGKVPFSFAENEDIRFDSGLYPLSTCAQAFIVRLLPQSEARELLDSVAPPESMEQQQWLTVMQSWMHQGKHIILVQEDESR